MPRADTNFPAAMVTSQVTQVYVVAMTVELGTLALTKTKVEAHKFTLTEEATSTPALMGIGK